MNAINPCLECTNEGCSEQGLDKPVDVRCPIVQAAKTMLDMMAAGEIPGMQGSNGCAENTNVK